MGNIKFFTGRWGIFLIVFIVALSVRLITLNKMGRAWDEAPLIGSGYKELKLLQKGDFKNPYWYLQSDHPPLSRYLYGFSEALGVEKIDKDGAVTFQFDFLWARLISVIFGSFSAGIIALLGYKYFSTYVGFASGIIFALIPFFVGLSQLATLESPIMLFFTLCVASYLDFLGNGKRSSAILTGIFLGLAMLVKFSNGLLIPLLVVFYVTWFKYQKKKNIKTFFSPKFRSFIVIGVSSFITFFVFWPMFFFHLNQVINVSYAMRIKNAHLPPPEVFFGRLMLVPLPYYIVMFIITTPLLLIMLSLIGALKIDNKRNFISISILIWFLFPFVQSFYAFKQHGIRYIIELYAPFALLCGIGLEYVNQKLKKIPYFRFISFAMIVLYLLFVLQKVSPYYLDYFNEVVGGNNYVYQYRLFQMGWWGQGIGEAALYISHHEVNVVTVAVDGQQPAQVMPDLWNIKTVYYNKNIITDYVISPYFNIVRLGFPENELKKKYKLVYVVKVDKAQLVRVWKRAR